MRTTTRLGLGLVAATLSLSACTDPGASTSPSATATPGASTAPSAPATAAPSPAPTPTPAATPPPPAPVADYDYTRLEFLHVGEVFSSYAGRSDVTLRTFADCPWLTDVSFPGQDPNVRFSWISSAYDPPGETYNFAIFGDTSAPGLVSPVNAEGMGIGTPLPTVLATYPGAVEQNWTDTANGDVTIVRVKDPASDARYFFTAATPTGPVFKIDFGMFPTENTWPIGYDCVD